MAFTKHGIISFIIFILLTVCCVHCDEQDDLLIVTVDRLQGGVQAQASSISAQLFSVSGAQVIKEINIGDLTFLVTKNADEASISQMRTIPGVKHVSQNKRLKAFPVIMPTGSWENVTDDISTTEEPGTTVTDEVRTTEVPTLCYEQDSGTVLWGLTRMVRRGKVQGAGLSDNK